MSVGWRVARMLALAATGVACGSSDSEGGDPATLVDAAADAGAGGASGSSSGGSSSGGTAALAGAGGIAEAGGAGTTGATGGSAGAGGTSSSGGAGAMGGAGGTTGAVGGTGSAGTGGSSGGSDPVLPTATGPCPAFADGNVTVTPDGKARSVRLWMSSAAQTLDGPLVFLWHGTGGNADSAFWLLGAQVIDAIRAEGGIVAAPSMDPSQTQWPWYLTTGSGSEDDLRVADEVVACAMETAGIDPKRIHSLGFSAGALHTAQMSYRRSAWLASVVTFSGGLIGTPPTQDPTNHFAAMIFHGGASDIAGSYGFEAGSTAYRDDLSVTGHYTLLCDHGNGHQQPGQPDAVWAFFQAHPFGTDPSPWVAALPSVVPDYCQ